MKTPMLTVHQCAQRLNVADDKVRRLIADGRLRGSKIGMWRVDEADLEAFIVATRPPAADTYASVDRLPPLANNPFV